MITILTMINDSDNDNDNDNAVSVHVVVTKLEELAAAINVPVM